jgi:hypothetical protein
MTKMPETPPVNFIDNPHAPEVFADAGAGFFLANGNLRIALESARVNHRTSAGPINRVVIARVVMPAQAAESLARGILDFLERMRASPQEIAERAPTFQ